MKTLVLEFPCFFVNEDDFETIYIYTIIELTLVRNAAGFFVEGFSMFNTGFQIITYYYDNMYELKDRYADFA
jgi:hypothetical protein